MKTPYTYVFIREDLTQAQQIVQAAHATLEAGFNFEMPDETSYLVLFSVKDEDELQNIAVYLSDHGMEHQMFYEPDYDTGYTAISTRPVYGDDRKLFKKFKLYRSEEKLAA